MDRVQNPIPAPRPRELAGLSVPTEIPSATLLTVYYSQSGIFPFAILTVQTASIRRFTDCQTAMLS